MKTITQTKKNSRQADKNGLGNDLQVEWIKFCSEEHSQQKHDGEIMQEAVCSFPFERREIVWGELTKNALGFGSYTASLAKSSPLEWLERGYCMRVMR